MHRNMGFTMIELLVVLVIVSLLSASALVLVRLPLQAAEVELAVEQIKAMDALTRSATSKGGSVVLQIEPREQRFRVISKAGAILSDLKLPRHTLISRLFVLNHPPVRSTVELHCESSMTATYGVLVGSPSTSRNWLVICGLSGEAYRFNEAKGDEFIARLSKSTSNFAH